MKPIRRILAILDPSLSRTPALDRALAHARRLNAELYLGLFDLGPQLGTLGNADRGETRRSEHLMRDQLSQRLEDLVRDLRERTGLGIQTIDDRERPNAQAMVALAERNLIDLVIKDVGHESSLRRMIFLPLDWELLRLSPVPVWLVAAHGSNFQGRVAAAVDPVHPEHGAGTLNDAILENALALMEPGKGVLRVLSAFAGLPAGLSALDPVGLGMAFSHEEIYERMRLDHRAALSALLARHGLGTESAEVLYGPPAEVLTEATALFGPDVLVVGSLRRRGLDRLLMGSTVERLVGHANCDILAVPAQASASASA